MCFLTQFQLLGHFLMNFHQISRAETPIYRPQKTQAILHKIIVYFKFAKMSSSSFLQQKLQCNFCLHRKNFASAKFFAQIFCAQKNFSRAQTCDASAICARENNFREKIVHMSLKIFRARVK